MNQLLIGTTSASEFKDYHDLLQDYGLELISLYDFKIDEPEETGEDFEENAVLKAKYYFQKTGIPALADASGLEIHALDGEPGINTHGWFGKKGTDEDLINNVYKKVKKIPVDKRQCRLRTVIAIASPFGIVTSEGSVEGVIAEKPTDKRIEGFPFRSVMYFPNYGKYFAELNKKELDIMNHRKAAIEKISDIFKELSR